MNETKELRFLRLLRPDVLKENLCKAAVYLVAYETLENLLKDRLESFYGMIEEGSKVWLNKEMRFKLGKKYAMDVRALERRDVVIASCRWFEKMGVLTSDDVEFIRRARKDRGDIAHEMLKVLLETQFDEPGLIHVLELIGKVDVWWLQNFEDAPENAVSGAVLFTNYLFAAVFKNEALH